ncbi:MAG: hypothetical protein BJ554DRAFT_1500, partial [Olpidium bornovanus]
LSVELPPSGNFILAFLSKISELLPPPLSPPLHPNPPSPPPPRPPPPPPPPPPPVRFCCDAPGATKNRSYCCVCRTHFLFFLPSPISSGSAVGTVLENSGLPPLPPSTHPVTKTRASGDGGGQKILILPAEKKKMENRPAVAAALDEVPYNVQKALVELRNIDEIYQGETQKTCPKKKTGSRGKGPGKGREGGGEKGKRRAR